MPTARRHPRRAPGAMHSSRARARSAPRRSDFVAATIDCAAQESGPTRGCAARARHARGFARYQPSSSRITIRIAALNRPPASRPPWDDPGSKGTTRGRAPPPEPADAEVCPAAPPEARARDRRIELPAFGPCDGAVCVLHHGSGKEPRPAARDGLSRARAWPPRAANGPHPRCRASGRFAGLKSPNHPASRALPRSISGPKLTGAEHGVRAPEALRGVSGDGSRGGPRRARLPPWLPRRSDEQPTRM